MMTETNKEAAVSFLKMASSGKVRAAYQSFVGTGFKHHNPYFEGSADSLMAGMEDNARQYPDKALDVKRTIAEDDFVVVHAHVKHQPDELGFATVHIFRFENNKIVELWDLGQSVPEESLNQYGMF